MSNPPNAAIHFSPEAFGSKDSKVYGREAASAGFLRAFIRDSGAKSVFCCAPSAADFDEFCKFASQCGSSAPANWISYSQIDRLAEPGCLYQADPCQQVTTTQHVFEEAKEPAQPLSNLSAPGLQRSLERLGKRVGLPLS